VVLRMTDSQGAFDEFSKLLVIRVTIATPDWVQRCVAQILDAHCRSAGSPSLEDDVRSVLRTAELAGWQAAQDVAGRLQNLCTADVPGTGPLEIVRELVYYPTAVLSQAGVPPVERDRHVVRLFPNDFYGVVPRSLAAFHPQLPGLAHAWEEARSAVQRQRLDSQS
jgi:hypothetical protein